MLPATNRVSNTTILPIARNRFALAIGISVQVNLQSADGLKVVFDILSLKWASLSVAKTSSGKQ